MCGIAGFIRLREPIDRYPELIVGMLERLAHRGPDEAGYFVDDRAAIGATRLTIIDLTTGSQPIGSSDRRHWICYNGELYNYIELRTELLAKGRRFETTSDTEVVLQAWLEWGEGCLRRLDGAFAFAIYDSAEGSLLLARDRFGERPLFYTLRGDSFIFASEMKAFLALEPVKFEFDPSRLATILSTWAPHPHQTAFRDMEQLGPGEFLRVDQHGVTRQAYAVLDFEHDPAPGTVEQAEERIRETLKHSVALRLRSDVEVGVYLSGGIDSAILATLATDVRGRPPRTFSVEFEDASLDESNEQRLVVERLGTSHAAVRVSGHDIATHFPEAVFHAETPAFRTAFVPMFLLSRLVRQSGVKVVLSGEGSDEAFLGYGIFKDALLLASWNELSSDEKRSRLARVHPYLDHFRGDESARLMGLYQQLSVPSFPGLFSHEMRFQNGRFSARLLRDAGDPLPRVFEWLAAEPGYAAMPPVQKAQWVEFKTLLAGYLLSTQGDRMAMAHGVENRCPFLDPAVLRLASAVNLRFDDGYDEKHLLKRAFASRLPPAVVAKGKFPYRAPDSAAFTLNRPDYLDALLDPAAMQDLPFLDSSFVTALTRKITTRDSAQISTRENQTWIFLLSLLLLQRQFVKRGGAGPRAHCRPLRIVDRRTAALVGA
jgi:asparagine synthase (glutamine-hydrolysing)